MVFLCEQETPPDPCPYASPIAPIPPDLKRINPIRNDPGGFVGEKTEMEGQGVVILLKKYP